MEKPTASYKSVGLTIDPELLEIIRVAAQANERTLSGEIRYALWNWYATFEQAEPEPAPVPEAAA
jgi:hypothetical protein